jgi:hypothetical protein
MQISPQGVGFESNLLSLNIAGSNLTEARDVVKDLVKFVTVLRART